MTRNVGLFPSLLHFPVARSPTRTPSPSLSLYFFLSPSPSTSPSPVRSILLATLLDISGAHACNEIRMPRALAELGHTPIREDELWALEETSTAPVLLPPTFPILPLLTTRPFRIAARKGSGGYSQPVKVSALFCQPSIFFSPDPPPSITPLRC